MNALVKKEIRLLLPNALFCCALGLANFLFVFNNDGSLQYAWGFLLSFVFCGGMAVMLALNSFGGEISSGTFSNLLAQPISRQKIWDTKILLLAATLLTVGIFWSACGLARLAMLGRKLDLLDLFTGVGIFGLVIFSGGLWTVLLLRQAAAAFWFTVLVPAFMLIMVSGLLGDDDFATGILVCVLGAYSLAGFFFARWLFFRAQDLQWSGGNIVMPELRGLRRLKSAATGRLRQLRPHAALFWKEIQLHQSQFIFAGMLFGLHLGVLAARNFGNFRKNSSTEFILEIFWSLWLVLPLLTGAAAVAEERKLGTLPAQLCLPVRRRTQFAVKFRVALLLSVLFGAVLPLLLEGRRILPNLHLLPGGMPFSPTLLGQASTAKIFFWYGMEMLNHLAPVLLLAGMALAIGTIAFYTSTLARNTLQALAPSVLGIVIFAFLLFNAQSPEFLFNSNTGQYFFHLWHGPLIYLTGVPAFFLTLTMLAYWNSQQTAPGFAAGRRNLLAFAVSLAATVLVTSATYHRVWEKLTPFEPAHGAAVLSRTSPPALGNDFNHYSVRTPDGRIWANAYGFSFNEAYPLSFILGNARMESLGQNNFYTGSNWGNLLRGARGELAGLKTDGTLWVSPKPPQFRWLGGYGWDISKPGDLVRFGSETNWSSQVWFGYSVLLTRSNCTLWRLGPTNWNHKRWQDWPGLHAFTPRQIGTQTNWAEVILADNRPCLRKTDGSMWSPWADTYYKWPTEELEPGFKIQRLPYLEPGTWRSTTEINRGMSYRLGIRSDGTFRIRADEQLNKKSLSYETKAVDYQFGNGSNWLAVAGRGEKVVTLKNDGTLWLWNFSHDSRRGWDPQRDEREMLDRVPARLGSHADWVAITEAPGGIISLAADGSLWYWPLESAQRFAADFGNGMFWDNSNNYYFEPLLDISRKPQKLANIFRPAD
ncbi:MAG TPA: ABC transporter permease subunit [bacterium]|jgi:ABC-type transport system involved in multi-copper enzyme maturation permease subunit|nr:ABC transporter permease subunit [bacterium]